MPSHPSQTLHIYTRVSTVAQADQGTSLDSQRELGIKKAADMGFAHELWNEGGKSSHHEDIADRPVLAALFGAIRSGQVKHLWVYDQSRLSRNDQVASIFRYECNKQGVTLYTKDGQFDLSSPQDKFLKQLLDAVAEFDNTTRAERTRLGKLLRVRSGHWHGGPPPYGYKLNNRKLELDPTEAVWVKKIFKLSASGASPAKIKQELDANGVTARRGGLWTLGSIAALLRNTHYTGQYSFTDSKSGQQIDVSCPEMVDLTTWQMVQALHQREKGRHQQKNATTKNFYLLRDLMYCAHCGRPLSGRMVRGNGESTYYCPNKEREWAKKGKSDTPWQRGTGCGFERSMNIFHADELVWSFVRDMHSQSSLLKEQVKSRLLEQQGLEPVSTKDSKKRAEAKAKRLQRDLTAVSETIGNVEASRLLKQLDNTSYRTTMQRLTDEQERLKAALAEVKLELQEQTTRKKWIDWLDAFGSEITGTESFTDQQRKDYIAGIVERINVQWLPDDRAHELEFHFRLPIVGDGIEWLDTKRKSKGYTLNEGSSQASLTLFKKDGRG